MTDALATVIGFVFPSIGPDANGVWAHAGDKPPDSSRCDKIQS
jgi:hypothetical protein